MNLKFTSILLPNGITLWYLQLPWLSFAKIWVSADIGHRDNPDGKDGLVHLMEHQIFKGGKKLSNRGCKINASTGYDNLIVKMASPTNYLRESVSILIDEILNSKMGHTLQSEKGVVLREFSEDSINARADSFDQKINRTVFGDFFGKLLSNKFHLGSVESMSAIRISDVNWAYNRFKRSITHAIIVGNFNLKFIIGQLSKLSEREQFERPMFIGQSPPPLGEIRQYCLSDEIKFNPDGHVQASCYFYMMAPRIRTLQEYVCYEIATEMVSGPMLEFLRAKGLSYSISSHSSTPIEAVLYRCGFLIEKNKVDLGMRIGRRVVKSKISEKNFNLAKTIVYMGIKMSDDGAEGMLSDANQYIKVLGRPISQSGILAAIQGVNFKKFNVFWEERFMGKFSAIKTLP